jgi:hypothetical protein
MRPEKSRTITLKKRIVIPSFIQMVMKTRIKADLPLTPVTLSRWERGESLISFHKGRVRGWLNVSFCLQLAIRFYSSLK